MKNHFSQCSGCRKLGGGDLCGVTGGPASRVYKICRTAGWKVLWVFNLYRKVHTSGGAWAEYLEGR